MAGEAPDFIFEDLESGCVLRARGFFLDGIETLSQSTPHQNALPEELDALSSEWKELAFTALRNPTAHILDRGTIKSYEQDGPWVQFLSAHVDRGRALPQTASQVKVPGDYRMAKALLFPGEEEGRVVDVRDMKQRVREHLRKNGGGRRLCVTKQSENKGSVVLVPAESRIGDSIWIFRGTSFPYVLRRVSQGFLVVGEACEYPFLQHQ
jgi:hypothetical protein